MTDIEALPVLTRRAGHVLTVTLNRPQRRNALDLDAWGHLRAALREAADDPSVRVVMLAGAGGAFCAGMDLGRPTGQHPAD
jgi:enoyl-CoA hydratase/carnithine racemase